MGMSGAACRRSRERKTVKAATFAGWRGEAQPVSQRESEEYGLQPTQWGAGVATVASLVDEANLLLARLSSVEVALSAENGKGVLISVAGAAPCASLPGEQAWGLLEKMRALQQMLTGEQSSASEWVTPSQD
ncbi:MAG: hypothetical protein HQM06_04710 [Magnetococcales bacterium]|nr:hypothetical protein [Magnetococcales bacterium]